MSLPYQALLYVSFGGPEGPEDVLPFLRNVTRGRGIPENRLTEVAHHYELFGGASPINEQNRAVIRALKAELERRGLDLPVFFGNRNWKPFLEEAVQEMTDKGVQRALALVSSAFSSYSGCRQYRENIQAAREAAGPKAPVVDKIRVFYNHPGFLRAVADLIKKSLPRWTENELQNVEIVFTAHSIPVAMARACDYLDQLHDAASLIVQELGWSSPWRVAFQSRSGPPQVPWLEPDILDVLKKLKGRDRQGVVVVPLGFLSDHVEVLFDLDVEAKTLAAELGLALERVSTVGTHPLYIQALADLVEERLDPTRPKLTLGSRGPKEDVCPQDCCLNVSRPRPPTENL
jgi:ferrochelatase